jgi:hypothetical protein
VVVVVVGDVVVVVVGDEVVVVVSVLGWMVHSSSTTPGGAVQLVGYSLISTSPPALTIDPVPFSPV